MPYPWNAGEILTAADLNDLGARAIEDLTSYTPTLTNIAIGTGGSASLVGNYARLGNNLAFIDVRAVLGTSGASVSGVPTFSLPAGFSATVSTTQLPLATASMVAAGGFYAGSASFASSTTIGCYALNASATYLTRTAPTNVIPATWTASDSVTIRALLQGTWA